MFSNSSSIPNIDKIGNLIIYLVDEIDKKYRQQLLMTKLLKLLYIIDETAVKESSTPVTGLTYKVWKMGPVASDIHKDLRYNDAEELSTFVEVKTGDSNKGGEWRSIKSINRFDDSEFSDFEMDLIDRIISQYGHLTEDQLIELLHEEGTLWKKLVDENDLEKVFETVKTSSIKIDLSELLSNDPHKLELFKNAQDSINL